MEAYEDKTHIANSAKYHTGKDCIEDGCKKPAGTHWSPYWCFAHNAERMKRISASLEKMAMKLKKTSVATSEKTKVWDGRLVDSGKVDIPHCTSCGVRETVYLRMRLDSLGRPLHMWWCLKCRICVVHKQKAFISKVEIESWGVDLENIPQVK